MTVIKSRAGRLHEWIDNAPRKCPSCGKRIGQQFTLMYDSPWDLRILGWSCWQCGSQHWLEGDQK